MFERAGTGVIGIDGSLMPVQVRDGLPSVHYGYAQGAAIWLDIEAMESQRKQRFVDPLVLYNAALRSEPGTAGPDPCR
jgi:hypothetical protein